MRYFIVSQGATILEKRVYTGDSKQTDQLISAYQSAHPTSSVVETDQVTFDATVITPVITSDMTSYQTAKGSGAMAMLNIIANKLGLQ
jgi:hypothetical protein